MKSEFIALDKVGKVAEWLRQSLKDISLWPKLVPAICIHCDNQAVIFKTQKFVYNGKSRYIRRKHNTVRQLLSNEVIFIAFVASKDNLAGPFTKNLSGERINCTSKRMRLKT